MYIISSLGPRGQRLYAQWNPRLREQCILSCFGTENPLEAAMFFTAEFAMKRAKVSDHIGKDVKVHQIVATVFAAREVE
jgi:hypothetical protein